MILNVLGVFIILLHFNLLSLHSFILLNVKGLLNDSPLSGFILKIDTRK